MTEQDVREGLSDAVEGEPPLNLDPDALVATARREVRRRRALVSASLATAAVAVAAVAMPVVLGASRNQVVTPAEQPATPAEQPATPTQQPATSIVRPQTYTAAQLTERGEQMRDHLEATLADVVPGATDVAVQPFGGEAVGDVSDGQNYLNSFATFTLDGTRLGIGVNAFAPGAHPSRQEQCPSGTTACVQLGQERGGPMVAIGDADNDTNPKLKILSVYHFRQDGSVVSAVGYNYDPTAGKLVVVPTLPVTDDQLRTLAADPALGL